MKKLLRILGVGLALSGCSASHNISYQLTDIKNNEIQKPFVININNLKDIRDTSEKNEWFWNDRSVKMGGEFYCINAQKYYGKESVANQISAVIASHLQRKNGFKSVLRNSPENSDFSFSGSLKVFKGQHKFILGSSSTEKSEIIIELTELKLKSKDKIIDLPSIEEKYYEHKAPRDCWDIYFQVDRKLKDVVEKLSENIYEAI